MMWKEKKLIKNAKKRNYFSFLFQTIPESAFCTIAPTPTFLFESSFLLFFLIPMTIMIFLYIRMGLKISTKQPFDKNSAVHNESRQAQSKKAILKMLGKYLYLFQIQCSQLFLLCFGKFLITYLHTVWKFSNFPPTLILREINFDCFLKIENCHFNNFLRLCIFI